MYFQNITPCQFVKLGLKSQFFEKVQISSFGTVIRLIIQCAFHHSGNLIVNEGRGDLYLSVHLWFFATEKLKHQSQTMLIESAACNMDWNTQRRVAYF